MRKFLWLQDSFDDAGLGADGSDDLDDLDDEVVHMDDDDDEVRGGVVPKGLFGVTVVDVEGGPEGPFGLWWSILSGGRSRRD